MTHIAVVGNTPLNLGVGVASDLALAGHEVRFADWSDTSGVLGEIARRGGLEVRGDPRQLLSGKTGLARLALATADIGEVVRGAELVILDAPWLELEERFARVLPHLADGQIVHVNTHGYWAAFRLAGLLKAAGKEGVTITEGPDPLVSGGYADGVVMRHCLKRKVPVSAFPGTRNARCLPILQAVYPTVVAAPSVLHTNLHSTNLMGHPAVALLNVASADRAAKAGHGVLFYKDGNTLHTGILSDAMDAERKRVCEAYGVPFQSLPSQFEDLYESRGGTFEQAVDTTAWLQDLPELPSGIWANWMRADVPLLHAPFVALARNAGVEAPLFTALVEILGALLRTDFWQSALTLERLGLAGRTPAEILEYALHGGATGDDRETA